MKKCHLWTTLMWNSERWNGEKTICSDILMPSLSLLWVLWEWDSLSSDFFFIVFAFVFRFFSSLDIFGIRFVNALFSFMPFAFSYWSLRFRWNLLHAMIALPPDCYCWGITSWTFDAFSRLPSQERSTLVLFADICLSFWCISCMIKYSRWSSRSHTNCFLVISCNSVFSGSLQFHMVRNVNLHLLWVVAREKLRWVLIHCFKLTTVIET